MRFSTFRRGFSEFLLVVFIILFVGFVSFNVFLNADREACESDAVNRFRLSPEAAREACSR